MDTQISAKYVTNRGKTCLSINNYKLTESRKLKDGDFRFRCANRSCTFSVLVDAAMGKVTKCSKTRHNHEPYSNSDIQKQQLRVSLKRKALGSGNDKPSKLIRRALMNSETLVDIDSEELRGLRKIIYRQRKKTMSAAIPKSRDEAIDQLHSQQETILARDQQFCLVNDSKTSINVGHCEEELANIESSYQRSPNRSALGNDKQRKPHFQQEQLRFLKPGVTAARSGRDVSGTDSGAPPDVTSDADANHPGRHDVTIKIEPDDQLDIEHNLSTEDVEDPPKPSIFVTPLNYTPAIEEVTESVGKRPATEELCELQTKIQCLEASMEALKKTPTATLTPTPTQTPSRDSLGEQNGMRYFLLSLLPELETMPEEQIRAFKIKVMMLVDEIKSQSKR
ncbi:uncharacterized protein [Bemisia tabaci]|uniref:uncharacterized protein isoform X3 n=1 Tax=Bemisia tabaci TaxID=7038 RepID=UPI003B27C071